MSQNATHTSDQQYHSRMRKVAFSSDDDALLMKYIARYNPRPKGRLGMKLYERLVENAERKWAFSSRHSVQSWRERYKNNQSWFDANILKYQEKHSISSNGSDNSPSKSTVQSGVKKTPPVSSESPANIPSGSMAPVGEIGTKKRRREADAEDTDLYHGVVKKMRQETMSAQGSQPYSPPHTRTLSAELRNGEKVGADYLFHEGEEKPVIGPDDYMGALSGSGESDREEGSSSKDERVSALARVSRPSIPANNAEVKPSLALRRSASPRLVGATGTHGEPSFSHQQHGITSKAAVADASEFVRDSIGAPPQPSQEPTPPHTSVVNSPRSPLQRQPSLTNDALLQPETGSRQMLSISQEQRRIPHSRCKRTIVSRDEDDIFGTPPPQAVWASPPPRTRGRKAPHLVEGPFRTVYTNSNGQFRSTSHVRSPNGTDKEAGTDRLLFPAAPAHELPPPAPGSPSKRASLGQNPRSLDDPPVNDPFKVPLDNREARRWTLAGNSEIPRVDARRGDLDRRASVHHIDLRALHLGKSVGAPLIGRAISSNTSESSSATTKKFLRRPFRSSTPPNLSDSNKKLLLSLGLEAVYSRMAENHKFHIDVVREVAAKQPSLEDTDRVLCNMRLAANREFARLLRQNEAAYSVECDTGESEEEDEGSDNSDDNEEDDNQSVPASHTPLSSPTSSVPRGRARRLALKIPTASPDTSPTRPPDYSPPTPTRARAFRRLERQGRVEEARLREARHVRRRLRSSNAEASPEAEEQRIAAYLLQLREDKDEVPLEKPRNTRGPGYLGEQHRETQEDAGGVGRSISPGFERDAVAHTGQEVRSNPIGSPPSPLGHDLENSLGLTDEDTSYVSKAMADTCLFRRSELEDEDADTAKVEEQVDADGDCQTLSDPQAMGPKAKSQVYSIDLDDGAIVANACQSPPGNVLTKEIGHHGFPLDKKYTEKAISPPALATLSTLDAEWTNSDDELLLDGNLTEHKRLVRRKGRCSVKFRTAHLYSLLLDG